MNISFQTFPYTLFVQLMPSAIHHCKLLSEQNLHLHQMLELYTCLVILAVNVLEDLEVLIVTFLSALKCVFYL